MAIVGFAFTIGAALALLGSAYLAGRWTHQAWLPALAAAVGVTPFLFVLVRRVTVDSMQTGRLALGASIGEVTFLLEAAERLAVAAMLGALLLLTARRVR